MFIRVTRGRYDPTKEAELTRLTEEHLLPALRQRAGFRSYQGGVNPEAGTLVAVSVWDTREQAEGVAGVRGPFEALGVQFDTTETYEIRASA